MDSYNHNPQGNPSMWAGEPKPLLLFKAERTSDCGYDEYDSLVLAAHNEDDAKDHVITGRYFDRDRKGGYYPFTLKAIGTALPDVEHGTVVASFNAG